MCVAIGFALFFPDMLVSHCVNKLYEEGKVSQTSVRAAILGRCVQQEEQPDGEGLQGGKGDCGS